jgi:rare lipoprotein A
MRLWGPNSLGTICGFAALMAGCMHGTQGDTSANRVREPVVKVSGGEMYEGKASYYHDSLAGNHTANGEIYDPEELTAASRTLPFGSKVRVVRIDTGRDVIVRINDRGPFADHRRIIDLSRAAAEALDMMVVGVVDVRLEIVEPPPGQLRPGT